MDTQGYPETADQLLAALASAGRRRERDMVQCPAHKDGTPSLHVSDGTNGRPVLHCFAGCPQATVIDALRSCGVWPPALSHDDDDPRDRYWTWRGPDGDRQQIEYHPTRGRKAGQRCRKWGSGTIRPRRLVYLADQRRPEAPPSIDPNTPPRLIVVTEGAKTADAAHRLTGAPCIAVASSSPGQLPDLDVWQWAGLDTATEIVIAEDADAPGRKAAGLVAGQLHAVAPAAAIRILDPADLPGVEPHTLVHPPGHEKAGQDCGFDLADWAPLLSDEYSPSSILDVLRSCARDWTPPADQAPPTDPHDLDYHDPLRTTMVRSLARQVRDHADRILAVFDPARNDATLRVVDPLSGIWHDPGGYVVKWQEAAARSDLARALRGLDENPGDTRAAHDVARIVRDNKRILRDGANVLRDSMAAVHVAERDHGATGKVTHCKVDDLDRDLRYLGCTNGVVDLHTGELLSPAESRRKLCTFATPHDYRPWSDHPPDARAEVDRLFAHLPPALVAFWWSALGYALRGRPDRRFYVIIGPPGGGKTTLLNALQAALGELCSAPVESALDAAVSPSSAGLTPEKEAFISPRRLATFSDMAARKLKAGVLKSIAGGDATSWRGLYHPKLTRSFFTTTVLIAANEGRLPKVDLADEAMRDRFIAIEYGAVLHRDPDYMERMKTDPTRGAALLARLVAESAAMPAKGGAPDPPTIVTAASARRADANAGAIIILKRRIVYAGGRKLPTAHAWQAWCVMHGEPPAATKVAGFTRSELTRQLGELCDLPVTVRTRYEGVQHLCWRDYRLLAEAAAEPDTVPAERHVSPPLPIERRRPTPQAELPAGVQALNGEWLRELMLLDPTAPTLVAGPGPLDQAKIGILPTNKKIPDGWRRVWPDGDVLREFPATGKWARIGAFSMRMRSARRRD